MDHPHGSPIYWLETSARAAARPVAGSHSCDVVIIGAGFTGLWTAYHLLEADPSLRVAIVEREVVGYGASGRNGGFAMTLLDMSLAHLRRNHGDDAAKAAHAAVATSVEEIGATVAAGNIDCEWRHGGLMVVATNPGQQQRIDVDLATAEALDLAGFTRLSAEEAQAEVHSPTYVGALREEHCGVLHPAKLAQGLALVIEAMGATIFEGTDCVSVDEANGRIHVTTPDGAILADQVVLATNAFAVHTPWFRAKVVPLYTYVGLTQPLTDAQWDEVGWSSHCGIEDKRNFVHYYRRTLDGRILWGGSDGVIHYRGRIKPRYDSNEKIRNRLRRTFEWTFPQLASVPFSHHWGGPVGITGEFVPLFGTLLDGRLHYGLGYNGHGVAPSHTGGKILRDRVLGQETDLTRLCFVDSKEPTFPPEPLRWIGSELTRRSLLRQDARLADGAQEGDMDPLLLRLMKR